jgi:hypothetical protein
MLLKVVTDFIDSKQLFHIEIKDEPYNLGLTSVNTNHALAAVHDDIIAIWHNAPEIVVLPV